MTEVALKEVQTNLSCRAVGFSVVENGKTIKHELGLDDVIELPQEQIQRILNCDRCFKKYL